MRALWASAFAQRDTVTLRGPVDKLGSFMPLFARASEIESSQATSRGDDDGAIRAVLADMGALP